MLNDETIRSIMIDKYYKKIKNYNVEYKCIIFDTAGMEKYRYMSFNTINYADGYFMIFSVDDINSYKKIVNDNNYINQHVALSEKVLYLIENKFDIEPEKRVVTKEEKEKFDKNKNAKYFETSALTGEGSSV